MKLVDTNLLLYAVNVHAPQHRASLAWLENSLAGDEPIAFDWIVLTGFLRISTTPRVFRQPLTIAEAVQQVTEWLDAPAACTVTATSAHWTTFQELVLATGGTGNLVADAHLAALAISHNATLVSCDTDFARFRRLRWENPLAVP